MNVAGEYNSGDDPMSRTTLLTVLTIIAACLLLAPTAHARRHYDPQHGRWIQRDPLEYVDGMNLYEYMLTSPTRGTDALGLSARERWAVTDAISREIGAHRGQLYYRNGLTDLPWLLNTLITDVRNSRWSDGDFVLDTTLGPTAARWWAGLFTDNRMEIGSLSPRPLTVVHEAVHLRHSLLGVYQGIPEYAVEGDESVARGTELMIGGVDTLRKWERRVRGGIRHEEDCKRVKGMWRIFWQSMNQILGSQSMTSGGGVSSIAGTSMRLRGCMDSTCPADR